VICKSYCQPIVPQAALLVVFLAQSYNHSPALKAEYLASARRLPPYIYIHTYTYIHIYLCIYLYICMYVYVYLYMYICIHMSINIYVYVLQWWWALLVCLTTPPGRVRRLRPNTSRAPAGHPYRGTSLVRKRTPLGPYRRPVPRALGES